MTVDHPIPEMTDSLGKSWRQPNRDDILVTADTAVMSQDAFDMLAEYSRSAPSGVYPGKMWHGLYPDGPFLHWFGPDIDGRCSINSRPIIIQDWKKLLGIEEPVGAAWPSMGGGVTVKNPQHVVNVNTP